jgi:hypothetical protein
MHNGLIILDRDGVLIELLVREDGSTDSPMNIDEIREQGKGFLNANTNKPKLDENGRLILIKKQ